MWTTESLSKFEYGGGATVLETAENSSEYSMLRKIKGYDVFACEAQYHRSCRKEYIRKPTNLSMDFDLKLQQSDMEAAHRDAFTNVYLHFHCESLNEPLHLRRGSYLHEQIGLSHTHIRAI